jgi:N-acetylglucosamine kinase-like BadF-type ATPase
METPRAALYLGVDGGGTRTRAAIVAADGRMVGHGEAGPSNPRSVGRDAARDAIADAVRIARRESGAPDGPFAAAFLGLAGVASARDRDEARAIVRELALAPDEAIGVDHDLRIALAGGLGGEPGIVLIAGTGSSCYGRTSEGISWRSGGWGPLIDDVGSGYWIGVRSLAAVARAIDGRGAPTSLRDSLGGAIGLDDVEDLLRMTGRDGLARDRIASLAPVVLAADAEGDAVAHEIVRSGIDELARMVQAVAQNLGWLSESVSLVFTGGLATNTTVRNELELVIAKRAENVRMVDAQLSPVMGAAHLALHSARA